ncbi:MAG: DUF839 domain-containing protein [Gammaproteobacteria bacterium]
MASDTFDTDATFNEPDGLWVDPDGRVFIQTDGRGQPSGLNDQMLVADSRTGEIRPEAVSFASAVRCRHADAHDSAKIARPIAGRLVIGITPVERFGDRGI